MRILPFERGVDDLAVLEVDAAVFGPPPDSSILENAGGYVIRRGERIVGYILYQPTDEAAIHIRSLAVLKKYRGRGYAHALMREVLRALPASNATVCIEEDGLETFYADFGFVDYGSRNFRGVRKLELRRPLL